MNGLGLYLLSSYGAKTYYDMVCKDEHFKKFYPDFVFDDIAETEKFLNESWSEKRKAFYFTLRVDEEMVGILLANRLPDYSSIDVTCYVVKKHRRKGYATRAVKLFMEMKGMFIDMRQLLLSAHPENEIAIKFINSFDKDYGYHDLSSNREKYIKL